MESAGEKRFAGTRLWFAQLLVFSLLGWVLAAILDWAGALHLGDALFVSGLVLAVLAGLIFVEDKGMSTSLRTRTSLVGAVSLRAGLGVPLSRAQALAVVSAAVAAGGLILAAVFVG